MTQEQQKQMDNIVNSFKELYDSTTNMNERDDIIKSLLKLTSNIHRKNIIYQKNNLSKIFVGDLQIHDEGLYIMDPSKIMDYQGCHIKSILPGLYNFLVHQDKDGNIFYMSMCHDNFDHEKAECTTLITDGSVSLPSGLCGFFDGKIYNEIDSDTCGVPEWYEDILRTTSTGEIYSNEHMVISRTFGNYVHEMTCDFDDNDNIIAIKLDFIGE